MVLGWVIAASASVLCALTAPQDTWYSFAPTWTVSSTPRALAAADDGSLFIGVSTSPQKTGSKTSYLDS